jgi:hypothetical protein
MAIRSHNFEDKGKWRPATRKMLDELMQVRDQLLKAHNGEPFEDSVELIHQMREERTQHLMEQFTIHSTNNQ